MKKTVLRFRLWIRLLTSLPLCLAVLFTGYIMIPAADHLVYGSSVMVSSLIVFVFVAVGIGILFLLFSLTLA